MQTYLQSLMLKAQNNLNIDAKYKCSEHMRIALVQNVTLNDHRSIHFHNVACELQRRGNDVDLILQKTDEKLQFQKQPYRFIELPGETYSIRGQLDFMKALVPVVRKGKYQIIHAKNPFSSIFSPILLRKVHLIQAKLIYDMRGLWVDFGVHSGQFSPSMGKVLNVVDKMVMHTCDHLITISPALRHVLISRGIPEKKVTAITGSGIDIEEIERIPVADVKEKLQLSGTVIGYLGTVSTSRQSDKLLEAFQYILNRCRNCYLILVGPEDGTIKELISKTENVIHLGFVPHKKALSLLKSFDLALAYHDKDVPIFNVAVPIKVFEYMAAGVPIVATTHAMYANVLDHRKTGYLTSPDPKSFAEGIRAVLEDRNLQKSMVMNAKQDVKKYSIQALVDQLDLLYHRVLAL